MKAGQGGARLVQGPVSSSIYSLMLPMMMGMVALISYNVADTFFVGQLGTLELAAMSFTFPVNFIVGALSMGLGVGTSAVISRLFGSGDREQIQRITGHAILLGITAGALVLLLGLLTIDPLFRLLGADDSTLPLIRRYMSIYYFGGIFLVVPMVANSVLRASGDAKRPALMMTMAALFNVVLDPLFIFGLYGFPRLELEGAAIATVTANICTMIASLFLVVWREQLVDLRRPQLKLIGDSWRRILHVGLPSTTSSLVAPMTTAFITWQVAKFGPAAVAGFGLASRFEGLSLLVLMSLSAAMTPFVGQNFGARELGRVKAGMDFAFRFSLVYGISVATVLYLAAPYVAALFTEDPEARAVAILHMRIVPLGYLALGVAMAVNGALNAMGRPVAAMLVSMSRTILVYAPLAFILSQFYGITGIFIAAATASFVAGTVGWLWFRLAWRATLASESAATQPG
jgi:putative MATE family efflux protein